MKVCAQLLSCVWLFATPWTVAHQAPLSMWFSRQEYWSGWPIEGSHISSVTSVTQSCLTLCDHMDCSRPGLPVHHQLPEFTQTHIHRVGDAIQASHPLFSPSPPAFSLSQQQSFPMSQLFAWGGQSIGVSASSSVLPVNSQDWSPLGWTGLISLCPL